MQKLKDDAKSTSVLVSPSAPSADVHSKSASALVSPSVSSTDVNYGAQIKLKRGHPPAAEKMRSGDGVRVAALDNHAAISLREKRQVLKATQAGLTAVCKICFSMCHLASA